MQLPSLTHIHAVQKGVLRLPYTPVVLLSSYMLNSYTFVQWSFMHLSHAVFTYLLLLGLGIKRSSVRICVAVSSHKEVTYDMLR